MNAGYRYSLPLPQPQLPQLHPFTRNTAALLVAAQLLSVLVRGLQIQFILERLPLQVEALYRFPIVFMLLNGKAGHFYNNPTAIPNPADGEL